MTVTPETLAAYADGELGAEERAQVDAAIANDPELGRQLDAHRALAARLGAAYAPVMEEPAPERLLAAIRGGSPAQVVDLSARRRAKEPVATKKTSAPAQAGVWLKLAPLAACLVLGMALGVFSPLKQAGGLIGGDMTAGRELALALDNSLSAEPRGAVRIGVSFRNGDGAYCRTFDAAAKGVAGLACRQGEGWKVRVAAASQSAQTSGYRTASSLPAAVAAAVEEAIAGQPLDATAERAARKTGWR